MVTYSVTASVTRASQFDREPFRQLSLTSGHATKEFSASVDLTGTLPTFPVDVALTGITTVKFLGIVVTGGSATIKLTSAAVSNNVITLETSGTLLMSEVNITDISVLGTTTGACYIEIFGMGL